MYRIIISYVYIIENVRNIKRGSRCVERRSPSPRWKRASPSVSTEKKIINNEAYDQKLDRVPLWGGSWSQRWV